MANAVSEVRKAVHGAEGDGAEVRRLFPVAGFMNYDPFVLWDHFSISAGAGFPDHPHRGFEGVTYVMKGAINHADNLGNNSTVTAGGLQRFTAGKGIVHSEMPEAEGATQGIQMWVNLPAALKKILPDYQQVDSDQVAVTEIEAGTVRHLAGKGSELALNTPVVYQDVMLNAGGRYDFRPDPEMRGLIYVVHGAISAGPDEGGTRLKQGEAGFVEAPAELVLQALQDARFLLCFGEPHHQPVYQHGPFVD